MAKNLRFEKHYPAFNQFASQETRFIIFLLKEDRKNRSVIFRTISKHLGISREKAVKICKKLENKDIVERTDFCPYCRNKYVNTGIPPVCDDCKRQIIPEDVVFKNKKYYPKYIVRIKEDKKEIIRCFIRFFAEFNKWLEKN